MAAGKFKLGRKSLAVLATVHDDLQRVVKLAITYSTVDFSVHEGLRSLATQRAYYKKGATKTMKSRHLTGHAVDLYAFVGKELSFNAALYHEIKKAVFKAAEELDIPIRWGGDWDCDGDSGDETFFDGPHFELPRSAYPDEQVAAR